MDLKKELETEIELLRERMHNLLGDGTELTKEEIILASQMLDKTLIKYHNLKKDEETKGR